MLSYFLPVKMLLIEQTEEYSHSVVYTRVIINNQFTRAGTVIDSKYLIREGNILGKTLRLIKQL